MYIHIDIWANIEHKIDLKQKKNVFTLSTFGSLVSNLETRAKKINDYTIHVSLIIVKLRPVAFLS